MIEQTNEILVIVDVVLVFAQEAVMGVLGGVF